MKTTPKPGRVTEGHIWLAVGAGALVFVAFIEIAAHALPWLLKAIFPTV